MNDAPFQALDADLTGQELQDDKLYITEEIGDYWKQTALWAGRLAFLGYIAGGVMMLCICGLSIGATSSPGFLIPLVIVIIGIVLFLSVNLHRYAVSIRKAADSATWEDMETGFACLRNAYAGFGFVNLIIAVIVVGLFAYGFILAIINNH